MTVAPALRADPPRVGTFRGSHYAILLAITLVAAALRLFRLDEWSFWVDEAHTYRDVVADSATFWNSNVANYPLGYLLLDGLLELGWLRGTGEGWLRLPFAFFGILTVPALALFGRGLVGRRAALLAAGFLALSPWHLYWSQNARAYSLTAFFALLSAFCAHRAAVRQSMPLTLAAVLATAVAGLSHPSGVLMTAALLAFFVTELLRDPSLRNHLVEPWVAGITVAVVVTLSAWILPTVFHHAFEEKPDFSIVHLTQTFAWFIGPPFLVAAIGGACLMALRAPRRDTWFLATWIGGPSLALIVVGATMTKVTAQYGLIFLPAILLLASRLIVELADAIGERARTAQLLRWSLPFVLLASLASDTFLYYFKRYGDRPRFREAASFVIHDAAGPFDLWSTNDQSMRYYLDRGAFEGHSNGQCTIDGFSQGRFRAAGGGQAWFDARVAAARESGRDLYFVVTEPELGEQDLDGSFDEAVRAGAAQLRRYPCWTGPKDMVVLVYKVAARQPAGPR